MDTQDPQIREIFMTLDQHYKLICEGKGRTDDIQKKVSEIEINYSNFTTRAELLQERSNELFRDIKSEILKIGSQFDTFKTEQNTEHNVAPRKKWDKLMDHIFFDIFVGAVVYLIFNYLNKGGL